MQRLFAALAAFVFIIALLAMESRGIIRRFCGEAVGEEVLPNFKNSKIAFRVHKHRFVWLPPPFQFFSPRIGAPFFRFSGGCLGLILPGDRDGVMRQKKGERCFVLNGY